MAVFIAHALVPGAKTRIQTSDFDMAAALLRVLRGMWRQSFGSDSVFWAAGTRPKVLRGRHFAVLAFFLGPISEGLIRPPAGCEWCVWGHGHTRNVRGGHCRRSV
jgi:hypothetical protein